MNLGLLVTFLLGIFIVIGAAISRFVNNSEFIEHFSVSIAFGSMLMLGLFDIVPEAVELLVGTQRILIPVFAIIGILVLKLLDGHIPEHDHAHGFSHECSESNVVHIGIMATVAVALHNIVEGMAVCSMAGENLRVGMLMAFGIGLHNIPMGMVIESTLKHEPKKKRIIFIFIAAISTFIGGVVMRLLWFGISDVVEGILVSLSLGMIAYIVLFELAPHIMHDRHRLRTVIGICIGIVTILVSRMFA